jgi:hypothetical protein
VEGVLGGWSISGLLTYNTGVFLRFGTFVVDGDPHIDNPTQARWIDTSKFKLQPAFTRRTNPLQYPDVTGPRFINLDNTLAKEFRIIERLKFELRLEAYNLTNRFHVDNPDLGGPTSTNFGRLVSQMGGKFGRQLQFSGRLVW